jgi:hypothetical protein
MSRTVPMSALALRLSTAAGNGGNRTGAEIAQAEKLLQKFGSSGLQVGNSQGHVSPLRMVIQELSGSYSIVQKLGN